MQENEEGGGGGGGLVVLQRRCKQAPFQYLHPERLPAPIPCHAKRKKRAPLVQKASGA